LICAAISSAAISEQSSKIVVGLFLQTLAIALTGFLVFGGVIDSRSFVDERSCPTSGSAAFDEDDCDPDDIDEAEEVRQFEFSGRHLLASYSGCDPAAIRDVRELTSAFHAAIRASGATLLHAVEHVFPPDGMTAVAVLSESHASIHTYPEHESCFVDIFTCGNTCSVEAFDAVMQEYLRPKSHSRRVIGRHEGMIDESATS
jgi:S-adenosylmethionine decarboxylase proenzyme